MECRSYLVKRPASWFLMVITSAIGNNSSTKATLQCGENLFQTVTCTSTKVREAYELLTSMTQIDYLRA